MGHANEDAGYTIPLLVCFPLKTNDRNISMWFWSCAHHMNKISVQTQFAFLLRSKSFFKKIVFQIELADTSFRKSTPRP